VNEIDILNGSPFDAIRRTDERGEYWTARDLMPLLGYRKWERFEDSIERAIVSARVAGTDVDQAFSRLREIGHNGGARVDYRLTRYAAYLVAMNGDVRKQEIADAQMYFTVRTREAETKQSTALALPQDYEEALEELLVKVRENKALKVENAKLQVKAAAYDDWINGKGCYLIGTVAKMLGLGPKAVWDFLYEEKVLISSGARRREPYAGKTSTSWFEVKPRDPESTNGHATSTTYITPYGAEQLRLLLIRRGLLPPQQLALIGGAS
jgi:DNA-damage-inducible protein D